MIIQTKPKALFLMLFAALSLLLIGCSESEQMAEEPAGHEMASEDMAELELSELESNKQAVRDFKVLQWDAEKMAMAYDVFAPDYVNLRSEFRNLVVNANDPAIEAVADPISVAIPDRVDVIEEMVAEGDVVGIQTRITGTHQGNLYGIAATGKAIDIVSTAFYTFEDGKIVEAWEMADEAALLRQLESWLPERSDGLSIAPVINHPVQYGSQVLVDILSHPEDSDTYTNKVRVSSYKSSVRPRDQADPFLRPANQVFDGAPYEVYTRSGFFHAADRSRELGTNHLGMGQAFPDRVDMVGQLIAEGDKVMISFLLTATNSSSLFGNLPSNGPVGAWEVGVHTFEGTHWKEGWWFGDDVGMLLQIDAPGEFLIPELH
jgi:predicted ester cyclase